MQKFHINHCRNEIKSHEPIFPSLVTTDDGIRGKNQIEYQKKKYHHWFLNKRFRNENSRPNHYFILNSNKSIFQCFDEIHGWNYRNCYVISKIILAPRKIAKSFKSKEQIAERFKCQKTISPRESVKFTRKSFFWNDLLNSQLNFQVNFLHHPSTV